MGIAGKGGSVIAIPDSQRRVRQKAPKRTSCPPHTPAITISVPSGGYETECLVCGKRGPGRETSVEAKQAFDAVLGLYHSISGIP